MDTKKMTTCPQRGERIRMIRVGRKGHIRELCSQDVEEFFHENGIGVLLGGRLRRVLPRRNCLHLIIQLGGVTELCNQTMVECTADDPTPLISHRFSLKLRGALTQPPPVTPRP